MNRRNALAGVSILALAACSATGQTPNTAVQHVYDAVQYILPLLDALALGISVAVPAVAPAVAIVQPYLAPAAAAFQTLAATMSTAQAQPIVQQILSYIKGAVSALGNAINSPGAPAALKAFQSRVDQAQAVVALLTTFVQGVQTVPTAGPQAPLPLLHH